MGRKYDQAIKNHQVPNIVQNMIAKHSIGMLSPDDLERFILNPNALYLMGDNQARRERIVSMKMRSMLLEIGEHYEKSQDAIWNHLQHIDAEG